MSSHPSAPPISSIPVRWAVRVFAWLGFGICAVLAWNSMGQVVTSACLGGADCDAVQSSRWAVWLGVPVAVLGLACYASLAALSVLTGVHKPTLARWVSTLLWMLALTAALGALWFTAIQFVAIGEYCTWCLALHGCGLAIAGLVLWSHFSAQTRTSLAARPGTMPGTRPVPISVKGVTPLATPAPTRTALPMEKIQGPWWPLAAGGAVAGMCLLIAGQLLFPPETLIQQTVALDMPIELDSTRGDLSIAQSSPPGDVQAYQANRIPVESVAEDKGVVAASASNEVPVDVVSSAAQPALPAGEQEPAEGAVSTSDASLAPQPRRERIVKLLGGSVSLDVYKHPVLGNPEAPHVVLEFVSYDCSHCRQMHRIVQRALRRYANQVAVVVMTVPFESECNKEVLAKNSVIGACATARMVVGVATLDPAKFASFHEWLMAGKDRPPSPAQAVQKAYNFVGRDRMKDLPREQLDKQIAQYLDLFVKIKAKTGNPAKVGLPLMVVGDQILSGSQESEEKLFSAWEEHLGVRPVQAAGSSEL